MNNKQTSPATLDIGRIINDSSLNRVSITVIFLCGLVMLMDGFDYTIITVAAPLIMKEWGVSSGDFSIAFSAAFVGYFFGALIFGAMSDRIGRKKTLIITTCVFSVGTFLVYFTNSMQSLIAVRVFTGIGIGGAVPCAITLTSEYSPLKQRGKYVSIMYSGFLIGVVLGGYLAGGILERFGWRHLFLVGFFAPLVSIILVGVKLPESIRWLSARERISAKQRALIARVLAKITPDVKLDDSTKFTFSETKQKSSMRSLFTGRLSWVTPVVWFYYLSSSIAMFFITSWAPQLLTIKGYTASTAAYIMGTINVTVAVGCMMSGFFFDKAGFRKGSIPHLIAAGICVIFTLSGGIESIGFVLLLLAGIFFINCGHMAVTILSPIVYPPDCRNLGGGAAIAAGRIGAITGPIIGGILLDTKLPIEKLIGVTAIPLVVAGILCYISGRQYDFYFVPLYAGKNSRSTVKD
jgi:benzoate transport